MPGSRLYGGTFAAEDRNNPRTIIAGWVREGASVLEIGPGDGVISGWLRRTKKCRTVGIEVDPDAASVAKAAFAHLLIGRIEDEQVRAAAARLGPYDTIIFADVLEHLVDPWETLRQVRPLLTPSGTILLSVPNVAHWSARLNLLLGRFDYSDGFLMDRGHLRWFTRKSAMEMVENAGYRVLEEATVWKPRFAKRFPTLNGFQFVLRAAPVAREGP
jgi:2-polyprenyl-3-methyl-5-hydroxy-6-metoxy-1,4-benzoquinol methylase